MTLPLSVFTVLFNSTPFFTALLATCYLKESLTWFEIVAMFGSFGGICLLALGMPDEEGSQADNLNGLTQSYFDGISPTAKYLIGITSTVFTAMCMSVVYVATRMMKGLHWSVI